MNKQEVQPGNRNTYLLEDFGLIAEHLDNVYDIDSVIRTIQAKILERLMQTGQGPECYELRVRCKVEHEFYKKIQSEIMKIRIDKDKKKVK